MLILLDTRKLGARTVPLHKCGRPFRRQKRSERKQIDQQEGTRPDQRDLDALTL